MNKPLQYRTLYRTVSAIGGSVLFFLVLSACNSSGKSKPSPLHVEHGTVGSTKIKIEYSSPAVKGRKIFGIGSGYLEQFGEVWRTGANKATTLEFSHNIQVDSVLLKAGRYALFTVPNENEWTIIVNRDWDQWGSYNYDQSEDVARLKVASSSLTNKIERMKIWIEDDSLCFAWNHTGWKVPVSSPP
ncbi:MAG: DUF2911 domain-containing protein [Bacteroidota bacterium]